MKLDLRHAIAALTLAALAGCGGGSVGGKPADWAKDACKTFPADAASKASGVAVAKAESSGQTGNDQTFVTNCTYSSADGKNNFGVLLRQDKSEEATVDAMIGGMKSQPDISGPSEDVAMPKGKAIWQPKLRTLSYLPEDGRMIVVTPPGAIFFGSGAEAPPPAELKAKAIAIANAIEG